MDRELNNSQLCTCQKAEDVFNNVCGRCLRPVKASTQEAYDKVLRILEDTWPFEAYNAGKIIISRGTVAVKMNELLRWSEQRHEVEVQKLQERIQELEEEIAKRQQFGLRVLRLTLIREAYDVMITGEKTQEFRKPNKWMLSRLEGKDYDIVEFTNGYGGARPRFLAEFKGWKTVEEPFAKEYSNGLYVDVCAGDIVIELGKVLV